MSSERTVTNKGKGVMDDHPRPKVKEKEDGLTENAEGSTKSSTRESPWADLRLRKLDMPIFKGEEDEDPDGWIHRVERYFVINGLPEKEKLEAAGMCLEEEALDWHKWEIEWSSIESWVEFKRLLLERFRPSAQGNRYARLMKLQQTSTVRIYRRQFERLSASLHDLSEAVLEGKFESGLSEEIQSEMKKLNPVGLRAKMMMAQLIEDDTKLRESKRSWVLPAQVLKGRVEFLSYSIFYA